ncbi:hypothetical protein AVEN_171346-1 [Araneus ventricosus]|uniref:Uncharacterized protein n=1 Tax=Araneus ventricosus TaxID=182803 RepID=A0A4Y2KD08_ARAVE|nr:hypothetical protein AVEN_171346-1 [Araneus ventricosus]
MSLSYSECPLDVRESLAVQFFVDAIRDEETQHSTRLMDYRFEIDPDLEKNEIRTEWEQIPLLSISTQHRKITSDGNADVLSRRLCIEGCEPCLNAAKFGMETDISMEALTLKIEDIWPLREIQKAQLKDSDIRLILKMKLKMKLNSADRPSWQEIAWEIPATK